MERARPYAAPKTLAAYAKTLRPLRVFTRLRSATVVAECAVFIQITPQGGKFLMGAEFTPDPIIGSGQLQQTAVFGKGNTQAHSRTTTRVLSPLGLAIRPIGMVKVFT